MRLEQCIGRQIEIIYEDRNGSISQRRIIVRSIRDGVLHATCLKDGALRPILLERILSWQHGREGESGVTKSLKLSGNGLWESSRMIIPQHKEALLRHQHEQHRQERPQLDDQEWDDISSRLQWSMENREPVTLHLYDPFERCEVSGIVVDIDMIGRRVRLRQDDDRSWISVEDILGVRDE